MADFLTRLAERTLGVAPVAQPIIASIFANGRTMPNSPPVAEGFPVQDEVAVLTAPQTPAVHPARPAQSAPSPQSTLPGDRISNHPDDRRGRFIAPTADVSARNQDPIPSGFTPKDVEPPNRISNPPSDRISNPPSDRISILPGDRRGRLIEPTADVSARNPDPFPSNFTPPIPDQVGDRRGRFIAPTADVSAHNPDPFPSNFTPQDTGGEMPPQAERSDGHGGRDPIYRVPGGWWGQHRQQNAPFATSIPQDVEPPDQDSTLPSDRRGRFIVPTADLSAHRPDSLPSRFTPIDAQGEQVGRPDKASLGDVVSPRSRGIATPTQQQQETSSRQQADLPLTNEQSGNPADRQRQLTPSLLQNRQVATGHRLPAPVSEAASSTPTIRVTIGRIDVRAVTPPAPPAPPPRPKQARPGPTLSLDDYARQRKGGER